MIVPFKTTKHKCPLRLLLLARTALLTNSSAPYYRRQTSPNVTTFSGENATIAQSCKSWASKASKNKSVHSVAHDGHKSKRSADPNLSGHLHGSHSTTLVPNPKSLSLLPLPKLKGRLTTASRPFQILKYY
jgi:hypothetical protein